LNLKTSTAREKKDGIYDVFQAEGVKPKSKKQPKQ